MVSDQAIEDLADMVEEPSKVAKFAGVFFLELGKDLLEMVDPTQLENLEEICHIGLSFFLEEQKSSPTFSANGCSEDVDNEDFGDRVSRGSLKKKTFRLLRG